MILDEKKKKELDAIVAEMTKEAEMKIYYEEDSPEWKNNAERLQVYTERVKKLEEHERTYVETGLMDHRDIHEYYFASLTGENIHDRQKKAGLDELEKSNTVYSRQG
jgi:hypothetical protein